MSVITKDQYLADPCGAASIPYWKTKKISIPEGMLILHHEEYDARRYPQYADEPYFRLKHDMKELTKPRLPEGFALFDAAREDFARHIGACYDAVGVSAEELGRYAERPVYAPHLWLAVKDLENGEIVASGIAELDREMGEGILEWIQVSRDYRGRGLGFFVVSELLWRMRDTARFATVSGQCGNPSNPEALYRKCGFVGTDVWHILRKR